MGLRTRSVLSYFLLWPAFMGLCSHALVYAQNECPAGTTPTQFLRDTSGAQHQTKCLNSATGQQLLAKPTAKIQNGISFADQFPGTNAGARIATTLNYLPLDTGGIVDARNLTGAQTISSNMFVGIGSDPPVHPSNVKPFVIHLGNTIYSMDTAQVLTQGSSAILGTDKNTTIIKWTALPG